MNLTDILAQAGGLESVARDLGVSESQVAAGAEALLTAALDQLSPEARDEWRQKVAWSYYIENDDINALRVARACTEGSSEWATQGAWVQGLAGWRLRDYRTALVAFDRVAREAPDSASSLTGSIAAAPVPGSPSLVRRAVPLTGIAVVGIVAVFLWTRGGSREETAPTAAAVAASPGASAPAPGPPAATSVSQPPPAEVSTSRLVWMDASGRQVPSGLEAAQYSRPRISPDGRQFVVSVAGDGPTRIRVVDAKQSLPFDLETPGSDPLWAPDGTITFAAPLDRGVVPLTGRMNEPRQFLARMPADAA